MDVNTLKLLFNPNKAYQHILTHYYSARLGSQTENINKLRENEEWLLIILDACRYDRFLSVYDDYMDASVKPIVSAGKNTFDYVRLNWPDRYEIPYITGAAPITSEELDFSNESVTADGIIRKNDDLERAYQGYVPAEHLNNIIEVWREYWDEDLGVCPPEPVTDTALDWDGNTDQMVVHYFQPHAPYIGEKQELGDFDILKDHKHVAGGAISNGIWERAKAGKITNEELVDLYDANLHRVLTEVVRLISETEFENVRIMGDHGEALGEFGKYGHTDMFHPKVRVVPWITVNKVFDEKLNSGNDSGYAESENSKSAQDRLRELGYIN